MDKTRKAVRSILSPHGLEQLVGSDIAAIAIPAAAAVNVQLLDSAAGFVIDTPGGAGGTFISDKAVFDRATGQWNAEAGETQATLVQLDAGTVYFYSWSGPAGATNITWVGPNASIDLAGNINGNLVNANALAVAGGSFGQAVAASPGYIRLGVITLIWGTSFITTGTPPEQSLAFVGYPIGTNGTLSVTVTLETTDTSVVWLAASNFGPTGFDLISFRTNTLGGTPGALNVNFSFLAVVRT